FGQDPAQRVAAAAGGEGQQHADRTVGIIIGVGGAARDGGEQCCRDRQFLHGCLLSLVALCAGAWRWQGGFSWCLVWRPGAACCNGAGRVLYSRPSDRSLAFWQV